MDSLGFSKVNANSFSMESEPKNFLEKTLKYTSRVHPQILLPSSQKYLPRIINMVTTFFGLYNNIINDKFQANMKHIVKNDSHAR